MGRRIAAVVVTCLLAAGCGPEANDPSEGENPPAHTDPEGSGGGGSGGGTGTPDPGTTPSTDPGTQPGGGGSGGTTGGGGSGGGTGVPTTPTVVRVAELYSGSIAVGRLITLENVYVTAMIGNKKAFYVADPQGGAHSGVMVQRCDQCTWEAPRVGSTITLTGFLRKHEPEMWINVGTRGVTAVATPVNAPPVTTLSAADAAVNGTGGADAYSSKVTLTDGPFTITSVTPESEKNQTFDASGTGCSNGPAYFGVEVTSASGAKIMLETSCYRDIDITTTQACSRASKLLEVGHTFDTLGGIFDLRHGKRIVIPAVASDYAYH